MSIGYILLLFFVVVNGVVFGPNVWRNFKAQQLLKGGVAATAVIEAVQDTGNRYNNNPQVKLTLEVTPAEGKPYRADLVTVISVVDLPRFQPGATVNVKYDPKDPTHLALAGK